MTDELISKTDVVKIVKSVLSPASSLTNVARARRQMLTEIDELESKPEPHWIPVTERLPETYESVLVWSNGYICKDMIVCPYDDKIWYRCGKIEDDDYWMPLSCLPEPYKGVTT